MIDATSGAHLDSNSSALFSGGTGKGSYPVDAVAPAGTYYLGALSATGDAVIAQTVEFSIARS